MKKVRWAVVSKFKKMRKNVGNKVLYNKKWGVRGRNYMTASGQDKMKVSDQR